MKTLHIVGFKNSGKTTLITRWIRLVKKQGLSVAVLKHHGHASRLDMPDSNTDSVQFLNSGADVSAVSGGGSFQLLMNEELDFIRMKEIASIGNPDVLLIEGYKEERGDKVVLLRNQADWEELKSLHNIQLVVEQSDNRTDFGPSISRSHEAELDSWFLNWLEEGVQNEII
ncbi:molybdopterin-guanine dinucleotide biosynthesis protein B [Sporosarcina sp. Marseille-Q4063]|uniref:molybdopterin-guanine dinucleotide biosynthesis protein B n=1 Tax=Sporosarcina sp. Marseille-Q4063 TaxID=2810514 RepID=UPI001BAE8677|nr:molybdopterin-guanine dinucleotide biosynthesis protein B [Sporosarcina sp. Marseille-Q4063]QUW21035.1 molybdopterin-guanine dinucleotide biosynthesis protein B [Sporosarcina sp. Marseille-Q4063]